MDDDMTDKSDSGGLMNATPDGDIIIGAVIGG